MRSRKKEFENNMNFPDGSIHLGAGLPNYPKLSADGLKITKNAVKVIEKCGAYGIEAFAVLKALNGFKPAVEAVLKAKPSGVLDSCLRNLSATLSYRGPLARGIIKLPSPGEIYSGGDICDAVDFFFVSEMAHVEMINGRFKKKKIVLMLDTGDLREGVPADEFVRFVSRAAKFKNVEIYGVATNHACFSGVVPTKNAIDKFIETIEEAERKTGVQFQIVSGGNSSLIGLIEKGLVNERVNNVRIGEAILLGNDVLTRSPIKWLEHNTFTVTAEVLECRRKESILEGVRTQNAFCEAVNFERRSKKPFEPALRAILNLGKKHFFVNGLRPLEEGVYILGASSDYTIIDVSDCARDVKCGDLFEFALDYPALMSAMRGAGRDIACEIKRLEL